MDRADGSRPCAAHWFVCRSRVAAFLHVTTLVDPTLQHKNRTEFLVDGPEIVVRPVRPLQR
jgi:hypothetical protein